MSIVKTKYQKTQLKNIKEGKTIHVVTKEHADKISKSLIEKYKHVPHHTKGRTYEEIMGKEKATKLRKLKTINHSSKRPEVREKLSKANKGKKRSDETKKKIASLVWMNLLGKNKRSQPEEVEKWLLEGWKLGKVKLTCPYCSKETDQANYKQWHGENCKKVYHLTLI